jgi:hypothetical protein
VIGVAVGSSVHPPQLDDSSESIEKRKSNSEESCVSGHVKHAQDLREM